MNRQEAAIQLKLQRSKSSLAEAGLMIQNQFYNAAVNRLYYACFYATQALLLTKNVVSKSHSGIATQLYNQFTKPGNFDKKLSAFYTRLMQYRNKSDYSDFLIVTQEGAGELIQSAKEYINHIIALIQSPETPDNADNSAL